MTTIADLEARARHDREQTLAERDRTLAAFDEVLAAANAGFAEIRKTILDSFQNQIDAHTALIGGGAAEVVLPFKRAAE